MKNNYAYCVCLTADSCLDSFLAFYYSFKQVNMNYPLVVIATTNLADDTIQKLQELEIIYKIKPYQEFVNSAPAYRSTINNLYAFGLFEYDKILLLNINIICKTCLDEYFSYSPTQMAEGACLIYPTMDIYSIVNNNDTKLNYASDIQFICERCICNTQESFKTINQCFLLFKFASFDPASYYGLNVLYKKIDEYQKTKSNDVFIDFFNNSSYTNQNAYVTLLSSIDYLPGLLVLNESLRTSGSTYPFIVLVPKDIASEKLKQVLREKQFIIKIIERINYNSQINNNYKNQTVLNTASKIEIFSLTEWEKLVYIDIDTLICKNIDELFNYPDGSMIKYTTDDQGFSGLFVFKPRNHDYSLYYYLITTYYGFDGDILGKLWYPVKSNPAYQIPDYYLHTPKQFSNKTKVVHFVNQPKPWENYNNNDDIFYQNTILKDLYLKYLNKIQQNISF